MKARAHLARQTKQRASESRRYRVLVKKFLSEHNICIRCGDYIPLRERTNHHFYGRTGELLCWVPGFRMACLSCHDFIEKHRNDSVRLGFRAPDALFGRPSLVIPHEYPTTGI